MVRFKIFFLEPEMIIFIIFRKWTFCFRFYFYEKK